MNESHSNTGVILKRSLCRASTQPISNSHLEPLPNSISPIQLLRYPSNNCRIENDIGVQHFPKSNFKLVSTTDDNQISCNQQNSVLFRHESLRRNRVVQTFRSSQETPINPDLQDDQITIPIENLQDQERNNRPSQTQERDEEEIENQEDTIAEQTLRILALRRTLFQFTLNLAFLIIYGLADLFVQNIISVLALFVIFNAFAIIYIGVLIITKDFSERPDNMSLALSIVNTLSFMIYVTIAFVKTKGIMIPLAPFSILGICVLFGFCCKYKLNSTTATRLILLSQKIVLWIQLLLIGLNLDGLQIPWVIVLLPTYFALVVLIFSSILMIISTTITFFTVVSEEGISVKLLIGTIWYLLNTLYSVIWLVLVSMIVNYLEEEYQGNLDFVLKIGLIHGGALFFLTLIFWKPLVKFQKFEIQSEMLLVEYVSPQSDENDELRGQHRRITFQSFKDNRTDLVMISPTFYSLLDKHLKCSTNKTEVDKIKKEAQDSKLHKVHRKLILNMPHKSDIGAMNKLTTITTASENPITKHNLDFSDGDIDIKKIQKLKKQESSKVNTNLCIVCFDKSPNAVIMNCGHGGVCYDCALESWKRTEDCILCRRKISRILKIVDFKPLNIIRVLERTEKL